MPAVYFTNDVDNRVDRIAHAFERIADALERAYPERGLRAKMDIIDDAPDIPQEEIIKAIKYSWEEE